MPRPSLEPNSAAEATASRHGVAVVGDTGERSTWLGRALATIAVATFVSVVFGFALVDRLWSTHRHEDLRRRTTTLAAAIAPSLDPGWLDSSPPVRPRHPVPPALAKSWRGGPSAMFHCEINAALLRGLWRPGHGLRDTVGPDAPDTFTVFTMPDGSPFPRFRYPPSTTLPDGLTTNNFGYRSPDLTLAKPPGVVRIACLGASAMVDAHELPWSGPELLQHWLDRWAASRSLPVRFEVLNAGREALTSADLRAIVEHELLPFGIDYVVYYEGANQCGLPDLMRHVVVDTPCTPGAPPPEVPVDLPALAAQRRLGPAGLRAWSVDARHLLDVTGFGQAMPEPAKPAQRVVLPEGIDERAPDPARANELLQLGAILRDLEGIRASCQRTKAQLLVCSFCWCAADGLRLDVTDGHSIWSHLNQRYWPLSYATVQRLTDLQNRGFATWAQQRGVPFFDLAAQLPRDPRLYTDAVHASELGSRLRSWLLGAALVRQIEGDLQRGAVPVAQPKPPDQHPVLLRSQRLTAAELDGK
ncbi:MAG: hypothetical protein JNK49_07330 [Planctomycetes bacterium]|nr:hypothetical protein [Planctomycetota bacterium]